MISEVKLAAYHEAGHAVACFTFWYIVIGISIDRINFGAGGCKYLKPQVYTPWLKPNCIFFAELSGVSEGEIIALAGTAAEMKLDPYCVDFTLAKSPASIDFYMAHIAHKEFQRKRNKPCLNEEAARFFALPHTLRLIERNWVAVERIAKELMLKGTLTGEEAHKLWVSQSKTSSE